MYPDGVFLIWFYLALFAAFCWATGNVISKYTLNSINKESATFGTLAASFLSGILVVIFFPVSFSPFAVLAGFFFSIAYYAFFSGLDNSEVSKAAALLLTNPIFTALLSALLLNEILGPIQYLGILLAVCGSLMLSFDGSMPRKGVGIVLLSSFLFALSDVSTKFALGSVTVPSVFFWAKAMTCLVAIVLLLLWRDKIKFPSLKLVSLSLGVGLISDLGNYLYALACSFAFVSLVTGVGTFQAVFVFLLATAITYLNPKLLKEDLHLKAMLIKIVALALLVAGVILVIN